MRALEPRDILDVWEQAAGLHPVDRALALLARGCPELGAETAADLPLGARDALLAGLRLRSLGGEPMGWAACPSCAERAEFPLPAGELARGGAPTEAGFEAQIAGRTFLLTLPTSRMLADAAMCDSDDEARRSLVAACVLGERRGDDAPWAAAELDADLEAGIGEALAARDPWADIRLQLTCGACQGAFEVAYDPGDALWTETSSQARRLLFEVHVLARGYGWSEREILSLSPRRRHAYLEMVGA